MPQLETALVSYLTNDPGVSALVADRVVPIRGEEGIKLPYIAYQRISASRLYTHDSFEDTAAFVRARIQFSCWAASALEAVRVGEAVLLALSGYEGDMSGELIGSSSADFELDDYEADVKMFRRLVDFLITYEENGLAGS